MSGPSFFINIALVSSLYLYTISLMIGTPVLLFLEQRCNTLDHDLCTESAGWTSFPTASNNFLVVSGVLFRHPSRPACTSFTSCSPQISTICGGGRRSIHLSNYSPL